MTAFIKQKKKRMLNYLCIYWIVLWCYKLNKRCYQNQICVRNRIFRPSAVSPLINTDCQRLSLHQICVHQWWITIQITREVANKNCKSWSTNFPLNDLLEYSTVYGYIWNWYKNRCISNKTKIVRDL